MSDKFDTDRIDFTSFKKEHINGLPRRFPPPVDMTPDRVVNESLNVVEYMNGAYDSRRVDCICEVAEEMGIKVVVFNGHYWWDDQMHRSQSAKSDLKTIFVSIPVEGSLSPFWKRVEELTLRQQSSEVFES